MLIYLDVFALLFFLSCIRPFPSTVREDGEKKESMIRTERSEQKGTERKSVPDVSARTI